MTIWHNFLKLTRPNFLIRFSNFVWSLINIVITFIMTYFCFDLCFVTVWKAVNLCFLLILIILNTFYHIDLRSRKWILVFLKLSFYHTSHLVIIKNKFLFFIMSLNFFYQVYEVLRWEFLFTINRFVSHENKMSRSVECSKIVSGLMWQNVINIHTCDTHEWSKIKDVWMKRVAFCCCQIFRWLLCFFFDPFFCLQQRWNRAPQQFSFNC